MGTSMDEKKALKEIAFINTVIEDSRRTLVENGVPYVIWGALSVCGTVLSYAAAALGRFNTILWIWTAFLFLGVAGTFIALRTGRKGRVKSVSGFIYRGIWTGMLLFDAVVSLCLYLGGISSLGLYLAVISAGLGMAYFTSSAITRNRLMFGLSFAWWAGSIAIVLIGSADAPLVLAGLVIVCELIPGIYLVVRGRRSVPAGDGEVDG